MCKISDYLKPPLKEYHIPRPDLMRLIKKAYPGATIYVEDNHYYYVSHVDWGKVVRYALLDAPAYLIDKYDCDNASNSCRCRVSSKYKLNTMGEAVGASPWGYHAFNLFVSWVNDGPKLFLLEPQTGDIYTVEEESGYYVDRLVIG